MQAGAGLTKKRLMFRDIFTANLASLRLTMAGLFFVLARNSNDEEKSAISIAA